MFKKVTEKFYNSEKEKFQKENDTAIIADNVLGCFFAKDSSCLYNNDGIIIISANSILYEKLATLYHEIGHYKCHRKKCRCEKEDNLLLKEEHAYKYMLEIMLKKKILPSLKFSIENIKNKTNSKTTTMHERIAAQRIVKTKLFKDCVKFVSNYG